MASGSELRKYNVDQQKRSHDERFADRALAGDFGQAVMRKYSPKALFTTPGTYQPVYPSNFNGEKNLGELGPMRYYFMDYVGLRFRSWQAFIESATGLTVIKKFGAWVVGKGLKLQSEPSQALLGKINPDLKKFSEDVEARWQVWAESKQCDWSNRDNLHRKAFKLHIDSLVGGDTLVVLRYLKDEGLKIQFIDGAHLSSPLAGSEWWPMIAANGNRIVNGVEISERGEHVAFYVRKPVDSLNLFMSFDVERIPAKSTAEAKAGLVSAFLVYGMEYRLDTHRGIPLLTTVLEKLKKMERYDEATLAAAEEQAKIAYQITHQLGASGENPFSEQVAKAYQWDPMDSGDIPRDIQGIALANRVQASTNKQTINMPQGSEVKTLRENKDKLYYADFIDKNNDIVCATIEIPPDVAMSKYNENYSASRAAIKDWENTLTIKRTDFGRQFLQNVYDFWLDIEILNNRIQAPGYLIARQVTNDYMVLSAYRTCRWTGAPVPHIDPMKEVQAEREKLGPVGATAPLTTVERATETLNGGDSDHNAEQFAQEMENIKKLGIELPPETTETVNVSQ